MNIQATPDGRVSRNEAAKFLGFKSKTLAEWHRLGVGPDSLLVGGRRFYRLDELKAYASGEKPIRPEAA
ncbi:DNA-binding protein [Parasphingorhabdus sp.]|uniref:DNA-binding protein n=1 Tax=Parasphingorhabdus sp. TaxID=2709688 RepID=UPI003A927592